MVNLSHCLSVMMLMVAYPQITAHCQWMHSIYVDPKTGTDSMQCLRTIAGAHDSCATLMYVISMLDSSTQIKLVSGNHSVSSRICVSNRQHIAITGMDSDTTIVQCTDGSNAGFEFVDVSDLQISGIKFENCGHIFNSTTKGISETMALFRSAVYILNSTNVAFESVAFVNNRGVGLALFDVNGSVSILESSFSGNAVPENERNTYNGGGGLYIEHTYCTPGLTPNCDTQHNPHNNNVTINISNCQFDNNHGSNVPNQSATQLVYQQKTNSRRLGNGGGVTITLKGYSHKNKLSIIGCTFKNNSAGFGGGIDIQLQDHVTNNDIKINNCKFVNNSALNGGGGVFIGIFYHEGDTIYGNQVTFSKVNFSRNIAQFGGGCEFASSRTKSTEISPSSVSFLDCNWHWNSAMLGAGLLLGPEAWNALTDGQLPVPLIKDCIFYGNQITDNDINDHNAAEGALYSSTYTLNISSSVQFIANNGTALSATAGSINVIEDTVATFRDNTGIQGGALALLEFATLQIFPRAQLDFDHNFASDVGGAIYAAVHDTIDFYYSRNCFIRYHDLTVSTKEWNAKINFRNNSAGLTKSFSGVFAASMASPASDDPQRSRGSSIYAVTIQPCVQAADTSGRFSPEPEDAFPEEVYSFEDNCDHDRLCGVATPPSSLQINSVDDNFASHMLKVSPGELLDLQLTAKDELNHSVQAIVVASISTSHSGAHAVLDSTSRYIIDGRVRIYGELNTTCYLEITTVNRKKITKHILLELVDCPTGFVYLRDINNIGRCVCSAETPNKQYLGILRCRSGKFDSYLTKGYWAGCDKNGALLTAKCPLGYCREDENTTFNTNSLPKTCQGLDEVICGARNRSGLLCGECIANHTVFFHSEQHDCHICKLGHIGLLFYVLSELLPVTLVFLTVVLFNVHLTSGLWNGVILYAQIIDFIEASSLQSSNPAKGISQLKGIYRFIYSMFNLNFFKLKDTFSFCLWNGATVMDVLIFQYLTSAYTFLLLLLLLLLFKISCCHHKCQNAWERRQEIMKSKHKDWVVHGISTFLVLSYAQCVKVSFQILSPVQLYGEGKMPIKTVVILSGNIEFLSPAHLRYALPAMFVLIMTTLPLILLIMYPNGQQLITFCVGETNIDKIHQCSGVPLCSYIRRTTRITRFKPLFDSFQGCFKDNFRFFASLLFLYRFLVSLIAAISLTPVFLYVSIEVLIVLMLCLHAWAQPYERRFYNILDACMYTNLAIVNGLSLFNYYWVNNPTNSHSMIVHNTRIFQLILAYLPLMYVIVMWLLLGLTHCSRKVRRCLRKVNKHVSLFQPSPQEIEEELNSVETMISFDEASLPYRMFNNRRNSEEF